jgi:hypothetical protein
VRHARKHIRKQTPRKRATKHVVVAAKIDGQVKGATVVHVAAVPAAAVAATGSDVVRSPLVISGIALAAMLFLLVVTVPSTAARFTPPGRVLMDHQTHAVLLGLALLLLTALLFALTGNG